MTRILALGLALLLAAPASAALAETEQKEPIEIIWSDLAPKPKTAEEREAMERMIAAFSEFAGDERGASSAAGPGLVMHGGAPGMVTDGDALVADYDGKRVSMPGYALPLEFAEDGVRQFLLVPYVGACVHVPPPPANQIVLIETETPYKPNDIFEAVTVTGVLSRFGSAIEDIDTGYKIVADSVAPYGR